MKKHLISICSLACLTGFFTVLLACDLSADKAATPKIVRKKIHAKKVKKATPAKAKPAIKSKPSPKKKPAVMQTDTGKQTPARPLIAQKQKPEQSTGKTARPKPPVKPKSDISMTRQSTSPKPGVKTDISRQAAASTSPAAKGKGSSGLRPVYNRKGKVDPFEPLFRDKPTVALAKKKRKKRTPRTPLEKIDISQLKLVGIILASSGNKALVEEASGKGYVIKKGTYMGTNSGKVAKIEKNKVIVTEEYEDVLGNVTLRNREIILPKPPGDL